MEIKASRKCMQTPKFKKKQLYRSLSFFLTNFLTVSPNFQNSDQLINYSKQTGNYPNQTSLYENLESAGTSRP